MFATKHSDRSTMDLNKVTEKSNPCGKQIKENDIVKMVTVSLHYFLLLMLLLPFHLLGQIDKTTLTENLKNISLEEAKQEFIKSRDKINKTLSSFEEIKSMRISGGPIIESDEESTINNFSVHIKDSIQKGFSQLIQNYSFKQERGDKQSYIKHYSTSRFGITKNFSSIYQDFYNKSEPEIAYKKIHFFDGSSTLYKKENDSIKSAKKIDSISATATYYYPTINNVITLSATAKHNQAVFTQEEADAYEIYIDTRLYEDLIYVEALNKEGKALWQKSSYTSTMDILNTKYLEKLSKYFNNIVNDIDHQKIKTKKQLINKLAKSYPNENDYGTEKVQKTIIYNTCQGNVAEVKLYFGEKRNSKTIAFTMLNKGTYFNNLSIEKFFVDNDYMHGIMDLKGNWVVKPIPNQISHMIGNYYSINRGIFANDKLYYLNLKTKQLEPQSFFMMSPKIYNGHYATITKTSNTNAIQGLINLKTQEVLLEPKYRHLKANKTFYWAKETRRSPYIISNFKDHKNIMAGSFEDVNFYDDYFVVETKKETITNSHTYHSLYDFYDVNGNKMNRMQIVDIPSYHSFGKDNLLVITDTNGDKYYILKSGDKAPIDIKDYQKLGAFSYGLASVKHKNNNLWGYINTKGKLVIPCMYRDAHIFIGGTAVVTTKKNKQILINLNNKTIFVLPGSLYSYTKIPDKTNAEYKIHDGNGNYTTYNHKGEIINK
ncbi:MAG: WG repeat-containing protein [Flavobacteriaceae bacterium]|nr:WG repeat-containing protein [Flavobacteriaceae bacterium]